MLDTSHIRVRRKERAGSATKSALDLAANKFKIWYTGSKPEINRFILTKWQNAEITVFTISFS